MSKKIEKQILLLLQERGKDKSICPSEVARQLFPEDWRTHMDEIRAVAKNLCVQKKILITQNNKVVDLNKIKGPIRFSLPEC
jgi:hypothetical protein